MPKTPTGILDRFDDVLFTCKENGEPIEAGRRRERGPRLFCDGAADRFAGLGYSLGNASGLNPSLAMTFWPSGERIVSASSNAAGCASFSTAIPYSGPT